MCNPWWSGPFPPQPAQSRQNYDHTSTKFITKWESTQWPLVNDPAVQPDFPLLHHFNSATAIHGTSSHQGGTWHICYCLYVHVYHLCMSFFLMPFKRKYGQGYVCSMYVWRNWIMAGLLFYPFICTQCFSWSVTELYTLQHNKVLFKVGYRYPGDFGHKL